MSIKGLTDRNLAFPEIGVVRKGSPKEQNRPGKDLTYFRVEFDEQETKAAATFKAKYGEHPTDINIVLPFNEIERVFEAYLEAYTAGRLVARSDGERYIYKVDTKTGQVVVLNGEPHTPYRNGEVVGTYTTFKGAVENIHCKPTGRLKVVIPELQRLAYLVVLTTSVHDIGNLSAQLEAIKQVSGGHIAGIPLVLRRRPKKISTPKPDGTRARLTKWMLSIEADPEWVKAKLMEFKRLALPGNGLPLLPEPEHAEQHEPEPEAVREGDYVDNDEEDDNIPVNPKMEEPVTKPEPAPAKEKLTRPLSPEELKKAITKRIEEYGQKKSLPHVEKWVIQAGMVDAFVGMDQASEKVMDVYRWLTGRDPGEVQPHVAFALHQWLKPVIDSGNAVTIDAFSAQEIRLVMDLIEKEKAAVPDWSEQPELFSDDTPPA